MRVLAEYPEAKRLLKREAEEQLFPAKLDASVVLQDGVCGVCLGDYCDDCVPSSDDQQQPQDPLPARDGGKEEKEVAGEKEGKEVAGGEEEKGVGEAAASADPLAALGLLSGCLHTHHFFCIEKWGRQRENSCPICKRRFAWLGKYSRSGVRLGAVRVGLRHQKDNPTSATTDASPVAELQLISDEIQRQSRHCSVCEAPLERSNTLRCADLFCGSAYHFFCVGFDARPNALWFCPPCREAGLCRDAFSRPVPSSRISQEGLLLPETSQVGSRRQRAAPRRRQPPASAETTTTPPPPTEAPEAAAPCDEGPRRGRRSSVRVVRRLVRRMRRGGSGGGVGGAGRVVRAPARCATRPSDESLGLGNEESGLSQENLASQEGTAAAESALGSAREGASAPAPLAKRSLRQVQIARQASELPEGPMLRFFCSADDDVEAAETLALEAAEKAAASAMEERARLRQAEMVRRKVQILRERERLVEERRQQLLARLESQAKSVSDAVTVDHPSGAALVQDLLRHNDALLCRCFGRALVRRPLSRPVNAKASAAANPHSASADTTPKDAALPSEQEPLELGEIRLADDDGREKAASEGHSDAHRSKESEDATRVRILLEIDRARRATTRRAEESTDVPLEDGAETPDSPAVVSKRKAQDGERAEEPSSVGHVNEKRRCRLKPSQSLVDLVKRSLTPFMIARFPDGGSDYRSEFTRVCRRISEGLTKANKARLLALSEEETASYWKARAARVEEAVKRHFATREDAGTSGGI